MGALSPNPRWGEYQPRPPFASLYSDLAYGRAMYLEAALDIQIQIQIFYWKEHIRGVIQYTQ